MKHSKEIHGIKAREKLLKGAKRVEKAVTTTLGSRGRNVALWKQHKTRSIHDGVSISEEVNPKDPYENAGAELIKQSARETVERVGDGTTLTILLSYEITSEAMKIVNSGINPMSLRYGLEKGRDLLIEKINKLSKPVTTREEKINVATISSEDKEMGEMIGDIYHKYGSDIVMTAEESKGNLFMDHQDGMRIDSGYKTWQFVTNPDNMTATVNKARFLITDAKLNDAFGQLQPIVNILNSSKERNLVVIGEDLEGNLLASLLQVKMSGQANTLGIKAPSFQVQENLQDLATVVGAKFLSKDENVDLENLSLEDLGYAERVTSSKDATIIIGGGGKKKDINSRVKGLKNLLSEEDSDFNKQKLRERIAKLSGGVFVINAGGHTETESDERKERAEDSILSTRSAIKNGIVPGGETTFLFLDDVLKSQDKDEDYAFRILKDAIKKPFKKLIDNAGLEPGEEILKVKEKGFGWGVNVNNGNLVEMYKEGVIDSAEVLTEAIKNAVSVAVNIITSNAIVVEIEEKDK